MCPPPPRALCSGVRLRLLGRPPALFSAGRLPGTPPPSSSSFPGLALLPLRSTSHTSPPPPPPPPPPELDQVVRLDALRHESAEHISRLWIDYHLNKPSCVSAVAPAHTYARLNQRLAESPLFVIPLPRETGCFVSILLQAHPKRDVVLFTELERYQKEANKGVVPPSLHLRYYPDLVETKGIALVRGEVDLARLSTTDAQYLVNQLQIYYLADNKYQLVKTFNHDPARFDYNSLINDLKGAGSEK